MKLSDMMESMQYVLRSLDCSQDGMEALAGMYALLRDVRNEKVLIELEEFFPGNLCVALGLIHTLLTMRLNSVRIVSSAPAVLAALRRNEFIRSNTYQRGDSPHAAIAYRRLCPKDIRYFASHLMQEIGRIQNTSLRPLETELERMLPMLIYELFNNAALHSRAQCIYVCGQYYPKKGKLEFSIADGGVGFSYPAGVGMSDGWSSPIEWALSRGHTTCGGPSRGLGLAMLRNYASEADTRLQIASYDYCYQQRGGRVEHCVLSHPFPGTLINVQFRTNYIPSLHSLYA